MASNIGEEHLVVSDNMLRPQGPPVRDGLVAPKGSTVVGRRSRGLLGALSFHEGGSGAGAQVERSGRSDGFPKDRLGCLLKALRSHMEVLEPKTQLVPSKWFLETSKWFLRT